MCLCEVVFHNNFSQLVDAPTHIKGNLLDLILTTDLSKIGNVRVSNSSPLNSDHYGTFFQMVSSSTRRSNHS